MDERESARAAILFSKAEEPADEGRRIYERFGGPEEVGRRDHR